MNPLPLSAPNQSAWNPLRNFNATVRFRILFALFIVVVLMTVPYIFLIAPALQYKYQYDTIIQNITLANSINSTTKKQIDDVMWEIVAGKKSFASGEQYAILEATEARVRQMAANTTSQRGLVKLSVVQRTLATLRNQIDEIGHEIAEGKSFDSNVILLEHMRTVTQLVEDDVQDYALFEVERTQVEYAEMQAGLTRWAIGGTVMMLTAVAFSIVSAWGISRTIYAPLKRLHDATTTIARHDLEVLATSENTDEITELVGSFNAMVRRIRELLAAKVQEQENLKKAELRALQAQINPHFLYNTLDTIIWMAESNRTRQVVDLVSALSRFFRITLSKGRDWITVRDEIEHVSSYLAIQKMRYRDILDYTIDVEADILDTQMLKLTLQPLVENALYHGIKNKRSGGRITVRGRRVGQDVRLDVEDNGIGMRADLVSQLGAMLARTDHPHSESGYGLNNVNQRIKLFYGQQYGLTIVSAHQIGTQVSILLPTNKVVEPTNTIKE
ncbi:sensor histidine kinase [Chloroflexia bacterium SDU3-3]|nr:sensor histidine kinase [Chloroflexia bacterium SDU3-3]